MAEFSKGQTFKDNKAVNIQGTKPKYFIAMNDADFEDDIIVCFVCNSENNKLDSGCDKDKNKFVLSTNELSFIKHLTSIMMSIPRFYTFKEVMGDEITLLEIVKEPLLRQIKNCIDWGDIPTKFHDQIKNSFK